MSANPVEPPDPLNSAWILPVSAVGMLLWCVSYILMIREGIRTKSYSMPLFALANNFAWEIVFTLHFADTPIKNAAFLMWAVIDVGLVWQTLKYGKYEWEHAPLVRDNLGKILFGLTCWCMLGHWLFLDWWFSRFEDPTECKFWDGGLSQLFISVLSVNQLITRGHTGANTIAIWLTRTLATILMPYVPLFWRTYTWPETYSYVHMSLGVYLWSTALVCDLVYGILLVYISKREKVLPDGRKVSIYAEHRKPA
ncbi:hypothetical protein BO94DRAFT_572424 [Aspergillus sclerotioniger CBS 115572]|uniref:Integral membrane protein n=1 Tax=Aspergillus sclerotioniger CBS 115572 TaxID=1450535 RepID=A0A317X5K4_9EURO|nr:hypothetical protein BO94DRAFT_572424 [Aspergillus sclerotioniger CBS 115572]PWY93853.1 hypothetical protein BO94DRAFT_572424 [Aspergillus sclerotioniger CBS 115572]